jgi:hypothetical protein
MDDNTDRGDLDCCCGSSEICSRDDDDDDTVTCGVFFFGENMSL